MPQRHLRQRWCHASHGRFPRVHRTGLCARSWSQLEHATRHYLGFRHVLPELSLVVLDHLLDRVVRILELLVHLHVPQRGVHKVSRKHDLEWLRAARVRQRPYGGWRAMRPRCRDGRVLHFHVPARGRLPVRPHTAVLQCGHASAVVVRVSPSSEQLRCRGLLHWPLWRVHDRRVGQRGHVLHRCQGLRLHVLQRRVCHFAQQLLLNGEQ